jgi:hypothetical protein
MERMKVRKQQLRECARLALVQRGLRVEIKPGAGIIPGARLKVFDASHLLDVAVRASLDGEVGFARYPNGDWMTILSVDEVVVATPSAEEPGSAEVLCFDSDVMKEAFDVALAERKMEYPNFSHKAPVFVALDGADGTKSKNVSVGLKAKAKWQVLIPLSAVSTDSTLSRPTAAGFIDRVKREFAEMNGVDVSKVVIEFKIIT